VSTLGARLSGGAIRERAAVVLLLVCAAGGWLASAHAGDLPSRGVTEVADAGIIVLCAGGAAGAWRVGRSWFWGLLTLAFALLTAGYAASALSRVWTSPAVATVSVVAVLAAYPFLLAALCVRAVHEEGFESGLATFCDAGMLVVALLAACLPVVVDSLGAVGTQHAVASVLTWAGNVGLFAGGVWLLYRLPAHRRSGGVVLMVAALGLFSLVSLAEIVTLAHGGPPEWVLGVGYGACYTILVGAPRRDTAHPGGRDVVPGTVSWRAVVPYLALCPLIVLWCAAAIGHRDLLLLSGGIIVVSLLALTRQMLLLREHRAVIRADHFRVRELTLMQEVARNLAATLDLDAVFDEVLRATSVMLSPPGSQPCIATLLRLEEGTLVSVAQHDEEGLARFTGSRYPLASHPRLAEILAEGGVGSGHMGATAMSSATATAVHNAGLQGWAVAPIMVEGAPFGMLTASARHRQTFEAAELQRLGGIVHLAELAIANALSYARQRDAASTDHLTGLRNRRCFEDRLESLPRVPFAILAIDVDGLKAVNDEYGHEAGDDLLRAVARTLGGLIRPGDVLARVGGDEFAVLVHGVDGAEAEAVGERMQRAMHGTSVGRGSPRVSVGYAAGAPGDNGPALWRRADEALYQAKRIGRDRVAGGAGAEYQFAVATRAGWSDLLTEVLATQSLGSAYQPIVRLADRRVIGYEALARLPESMPDSDVEELFATAKRLGMLRDLDWLGRRAAMAGAGPVVAGGHALFINISSVALLDPVHDVDQMLLLCRWSGRSPEDVVLEITERETISEVGRLRGVLASYREHGFRFALDDVGEGHSTLEVLTAARPEFVKIARSLVQGVDSNASVAAIRATVEFARATDATVVAEGVETETEARLMERLGVGCGQGWLFGRPMLLPSRAFRHAG